MDEDLKLYIPLGVKPEAELFTGFGKKQLFQALIGSLVMGGAAALVWLFTANVTTPACGKGIREATSFPVRPGQRMSLPGMCMTGCNRCWAWCTRMGGI